MLGRHATTSATPQHMVALINITGVSLLITGEFDIISDFCLLVLSVIERGEGLKSLTIIVDWFVFPAPLSIISSVVLKLCH